MTALTQKDPEDQVCVDFESFMKGKRNAYRKVYNQAHKEELNARCKAYYQAHREEMIKRRKQWYQLHPKEEKKRNRRYKQSIKRFVLSGLSNSETPCCHCCGETILAFLTIGHEKDGDGKADRLEKGIGFSFYRWLVRNYLKTQTWPTNLKTECFNCNCGKTKDGICPHKLKLAKT